ncbi:hypothetical protein BCR35DRAFT_324768 [Leucosporidium creatinivorum]|uniref:Uncharacterized protein n=1 Tax=Leucosporidium creatinivorum TaxID=106004 RepID=A0A1Y2FL83_9BASI|nr:hypothetical protein BCR35DRAFT_324768 [Leucosporidium creatinivorum]
MKSFIGLLALASLAFGSPSLEVESTPLRVSADVTDDSSLTVHILRTDDLLSHDIPRHERFSVLERISHVELRVSLDKEDGLFAINDEKIDLSGLVGDEHHPQKHVQAIKAQAFSLAHTNTIDGKVYTTEELAALVAEHLPAGIIGTEVTVVEDKLDETALAQAAEEESSDEARVSMKSYSVFVRITEVDDVSIPNKKDISHDSTILIPVLQVSLTIDDESGKPVKMQAISVRPIHRPFRADRPSRGGPKGSRKRPSPDRRPHHEHEEESELDSRPQRHFEEHESMERRPSRGEGSRRPPPPFFGEDEEEFPSSHRHHHQDHERMDDFEHHSEHHGPPRGPPRGPPPPFRGPPHHGPPRGPPAFVRWIAQRLGIPPPPPPPRHHRHHHHDEDSEERFGPRGDRPHHRPHHSEEGPEGEPFGEDESPRHRPHHHRPSPEEMDEHMLEMFEGDEPRPHPFHHRRPDFDGPHGFDDDEGPHPHPHFRHHRFHHGPPRRLAHRLRHFLRSAFFLAEGIAMSPVFLLVSGLLKMVIGAFVLFKLAKTIKKKVIARREGRLRLQEDQGIVAGASSSSAPAGEKDVLPRYVDDEVAVQEKV